MTPAQQLKAQQYAALFLQLAQREDQRFGELITTRPDTQLLGRTEFDLRTLVHRLGAAFLETAHEERKKGLPQASIVCPNCASDSNLNGLRLRTVLGLLGGLKIRHYYYHCVDCRHGTLPRVEWHFLKGKTE